MANITRLTSKCSRLQQLILTSNRVAVHRWNIGYSEPLVAAYSQPMRWSHHPSFKYPEIPSEISARNLILRLDDKGRELLLQELVKYQQENSELKIDPSMEPQVTSAELRKVFWFNGVPFIGFGLLDNMIMIVAGEYIDVTLGAAFGISTMAAAALGNLISDVVGVGSAGYVEKLVSNIGINPPHLTPTQTVSWKTRWTSALGRALGITIGCIIGMFPLLFMHKDEPETETTDQAIQTITKSMSPESGKS